MPAWRCCLSWDRMLARWRIYVYWQQGLKPANPVIQGIRRESRPDSVLKDMYFTMHANHTGRNAPSVPLLAVGL